MLLLLRVMEGLRSVSGQLSDPIQSANGTNVTYLLVHLFSKCGPDLSRPPSREGITVPGRPVLPVDNYHQVVTAGHCLAVAGRLFTPALVAQAVTSSHWLPELVTNLWRKLAEGEFIPTKVYWQVVWAI